MAETNEQKGTLEQYQEALAAQQTGVAELNALEKVKLLEAQLATAFMTATSLKQNGQSNMEIVQQSLLAIADKLPDKALAHALREKFYTKGEEVQKVQLKQVAVSPLSRQRAPAPPYGVARTTNPTAKELEADQAGDVNTRFTAPVYGQNTGTENPNPPAVEQGKLQNSEEAAAGNGENQTAPPVDEKPEDKVAAEMADQVQELPQAFLDGTVTLGRIQASTAEDLAANFGMKELVSILNDLGEQQGKSRSKIAVATRIKTALL